MVEEERIVGGVSSVERRFYISSPRISHSAKPNPKGALAWVYVMWSDEELGKAVFGKVVD